MVDSASGMALAATAGALLLFFSWRRYRRAGGGGNGSGATGVPAPRMDPSASASPLVGVLNKLYLSRAFTDADDGASMARFMAMLSSVVAGFDEEKLAPVVAAEAAAMVGRMKFRSSSMGGAFRIDVCEESLRFVVRTAARCFVDLDLDDNLFQSVAEFNALLKRLVTLAHFFPKFVLRWTLGHQLAALRCTLRKDLAPTIERYRTDPTLSASPLLRRAVDSDFTDNEVSDLILCLFYLASESMTGALTSTLADLANSRSTWEKVYKEVEPCVQAEDVHGLLAAATTLHQAVNKSICGFPHAFAGAKPGATGDESCLHGDHHLVTVASASAALPVVASCPGMTFAVTESKLALAFVVAAFLKPNFPDLTHKSAYFTAAQLRTPPTWFTSRHGAPDVAVFATQA